MTKQQILSPFDAAVYIPFVIIPKTDEELQRRNEQMLDSSVNRFDLQLFASGFTQDIQDSLFDEWPETFANQFAAAAHDARERCRVALAYVQWLRKGRAAVGGVL